MLSSYSKQLEGSVSADIRSLLAVSKTFPGKKSEHFSVSLEEEMLWKQNSPKYQSFTN